jgi:branched-subunit amino acid transport protein
MSDFWLVVGVGAITYASRVVFLARPGGTPAGRVARFLERFPLALFVSLAATTLVVPGSGIDPSMRYAALGGAVAGGLLTRRSLVGVLMAGGSAYWIARLVAG